MKKDGFEKYCFLFIIFMIGSFIGFILENLYTILIKGQYALRQGLIYEPLIPIYGIGALTLYFLLNHRVLNKSDKYKIIKIFLVSFIAGSAVEYICSLAQQSIFGTISWDYSKKLFNINGRINLFHSVLWGILGVFFYYIVLPIINKFQVKSNVVKYGVLILTMIFILDTIISAAACYRQKERRENIIANNKIEMLLDKHYPDEFLNNIYNNAKVVEKNKWKNCDISLLIKAKW